jgi:hypothetical protein
MTTRKSRGDMACTDDGGAPVKKLLRVAGGRMVATSLPAAWRS